MGNSHSSSYPNDFIDNSKPLRPHNTPQFSRRAERGTSGSHSATNLRTPSGMEPPPPYSPTADRALPAEPPPVPARDRRRVSLRDTSSSSLGPSTNSHRRTVSHSPGSRTAQNIVPPPRRAPGGGVGGFLSPSDVPARNYPPISAQPLPRSRSTTSVSPTSNSLAEVPQGSTTTTNAATRNLTRRNSREDPLELLRKFDTVIIVDDSSSMEGPLWYEARDALAGIADAAARYDTNGIDLYFLNDETVGHNLRISQEVEAIFDRITPSGITPIASKLEELLLDYLLRFEEDPVKPKPVNFVVLTDGAPTDDPEDVIVTAAKRLDAQHAPVTQVGIQFVQIGNDPEATEALKELDDELSSKHNIRDMVDTTLYTGQRLTAELLGKILLGGVNRRVDKKGYKVAS